jgi:RNA-directed DNA polymerase
MIIEKMSQDLGVSTAFITSLANGASYEYKSYWVSKRNGKKREIHQPSRKLKALQIWILRNVLNVIPTHLGAMAYQPGSSIMKNARVHAASRYLVRLDVWNFFPSIRAEDFDLFVAKREQLASTWSNEDKQILRSLLFRHGKLTIGAPTSPTVSNVLCFDLDSKLDEYATNRGLRYSRYADDMFFSSTTPNLLSGVETYVETVLSTLELPANLKLNKVKTVHCSRKRRRIVTGISLGSDGKARVPRHLKRKARSMIHKFEALSEAERLSLAGTISFIAGFEPNFLNNLVLKYGLDAVKRATTLPPILERQRIHLPKVQPSPPSKSRRSGNTILRDILKAAGFDLGND